MLSSSAPISSFETGLFQLSELKSSLVPFFFGLPSAGRLWHQRRMRFFLLVLFFGFSGGAHATEAVSPTEWKRTGSKNGVELYKREVPDSDVIQLKGEGVLNAPLWKIAATLLDTKRAKEWIDSMEESRVVEHLGAKTYIEYNHIGTPFVLKDRDFVSRVNIKTDPVKKTFALIYAPYTAPIEKSDYIRGKILSGVFGLTKIDAERTRLNAEVHCDPRGSVPKWIVNFFQSDWAYDTFLALRKQLEKNDVRIVDEFKHVLLPLQSY